MAKELRYWTLVVFYFCAIWLIVIFTMGMTILILRADQIALGIN